MGCFCHLQRPVGSSLVVHEPCALPSRHWVVQLCFSAFSSLPYLPDCSTHSMRRGYQQIPLVPCFLLHISICLASCSTPSSPLQIFHALLQVVLLATSSEVVKYRFHLRHCRAIIADLFCISGCIFYSSTTDNNLCSPVFIFTWKSWSFKLTEMSPSSGRLGVKVWKTLSINLGGDTWHHAFSFFFYPVSLVNINWEIIRIASLERGAARGDQS